MSTDPTNVLLAEVGRIAGRGKQGGEGFCEACGKHMLAGPDICLGEIPGVSHACCGHGNVRDAYVTFGGLPNQDAGTIPVSTTLYGIDALVFFEAIKRAGRTYR